MYLYEKLGFSRTCVNNSTIYVNQTIMLYALNLYIDVCQLFFNKTGGKRQDVLDKMIDTYQLKEKNISEIVTQRYGQLFFDEA